MASDVSVERGDSDNGGRDRCSTIGAATESASRVPPVSDVLQELGLSSSGGHELCNDLASTASLFEGVGIGSASEKGYGNTSKDTK
jgi:hypothetical protein